MAEMFKVNAPVRKPLFEGVQGENEARSIVFDITPWVEELGDGAVTATAKRSQDSQPYPVTVTKDGNTVTWKPTSTDTAFAGVGSFQLEYTVDDVLAKTCIWSTMVAPSLDPAGDPPDPYDNWLAEMRSIEAGAIQAADDAEDSADAAAASAASVAGITAEVEDIRIGADGTTYPSAGDAVRGQVSDLKSDLQEITEETTSEGFDESDNLVDGLTLSSGYYPNGYNTVYSNDSFSYLGIDVTGITKLKINGTHHIYTVTQFPAMGVFLDSENTWLADVRDQAVDLSSFPVVVNVPNGATKLNLNTDYKASDYPSTLPSDLYVYPWRTNVESIKVPYSALEKTPVTLADLSQGDKKIKIIAGVIRNSGNGWEYINDSGHEPLNLTSVSADSYGRIKIDYGFTASKVLSLVATPDETFAGQYMIGGSVGLDNSLFNVYALPKAYGGLVTLSDNSISVYNSNFTSATFNTSTGEIRIYHPTLIALRAQDKFNISANASAYNVVLGSQGNDYICLYLRDQSGAIVKDTTGVSINIIATRQINPVFVNANNIVDAGGNFWIYGVMEI